MLYAIKFRELNILLSSAIDSNSKILYIRDPLQRVAKVAPFLTLDGHPYPVVENGQLVWVVDGYTSTDNYPYSKRIDNEQASSNTFSPNGLAVGQNAGEINFMRNSVKATVNAYTGVVHLYQWGQASPMLQTWMKAFPGLDRTAEQHPEAAAAAPALPGVALRRAAPDPGSVPRASAGFVLRRPELLGGSQ